MPPWAAIECALLGESWKQKALTLYPSSARVAAAEPPAKPVPTTIISMSLLFAGLTKLILFLWFVHLSSIGPSGIFEFKFWEKDLGFKSFKISSTSKV